MKKQELVAIIAKEAGITKVAAAKALKATTDAIGDAIAKGESVQLVGFGTFGSKKRAARTGKNPRTGEKIKIAASTVAAFKAGKALKDKVNG
ncbi:MAG: HU family DNA-binding protein [Clostridia bacterium]|nr:HU family DNA-binding protein [Clostridia bacterium]